MADMTMPSSYSTHNGKASMNCEVMSGGVTTAATINAPTMKYGRIARSLATLVMPSRVITTSTIGVSKVSPNARNIVSANPKYASMSGETLMASGANPKITGNSSRNTTK